MKAPKQTITGLAFKENELNYSAAKEAIDVQSKAAEAKKRGA
jgi:hypothetical protein